MVVEDPKGESGTPLGYRLTASYRGQGKIACTFDGHGGGFAYRPDGTLVLSHQPRAGGALTDAAGATLSAWDAQGRSQGGDGGSGRVCVALGDCMALLFTPPTTAEPTPTIGVAFRCNGFQRVVHQGTNAQERDAWDSSLDGLPAIRGLHASTRSRRRPTGGGGSAAALPSALAQAGGPRAGIGGGIADALALLPDLKVRAADAR